LPDPAQLGNAGSFFKNPVVSSGRFHDLKARWPGLVAYAQGDGTYKLAAGWLVEQAGWKGRREGAVGVHERQALVLVNYGGADAGAVADLAGRVRADVAARFGVELEQEPVAVR
jgi:UDP-N-acetylmuramate dehydrogenase